MEQGAGVFPELLLFFGRQVDLAERVAGLLKEVVDGLLAELRNIEAVVNGCDGLNFLCGHVGRAAHPAGQFLTGCLVGTQPGIDEQIGFLVTENVAAYFLPNTAGSP